LANIVSISKSTFDSKASLIIYRASVRVSEWQCSPLTGLHQVYVEFNRFDVDFNSNLFLRCRYVAVCNSASIDLSRFLYSYYKLKSLLNGNAIRWSQTKKLR